MIVSYSNFAGWYSLVQPAPEVCFDLRSPVSRLIFTLLVPSWVSGGGFDNATLISILQNHINTEAGRYAGQLRSWDVINEPFNDDGSSAFILSFKTFAYNVLMPERYIHERRLVQHHWPSLYSNRTWLRAHS